MKYLTPFIIGIIVSIVVSSTIVSAAVSVLTPSQGGTGIGSTTAANVGNCLKVLDDSPFRYELGSCGTGGGSGTVTSVAMTVPTGLTVTGSPVTTSGTLAVSYDAGYTGVLTASTTEWAASYASTTALSNSYIRNLFTASSPVAYNSGTGAFSIAADSIGDTELAFNTGQDLTTASSPTFSGLTLSTLTVTHATTTSLYASGNVGIGSSTPLSLLTVGTRSALATSTHSFYLAGGSAMHDASVPSFMSGIDTSNASANTTFVSGKYLYVGNNATTTGTGCSATDASDCELRIYDISNLASTTYIGGWDRDTANVQVIQVVGKYAYVGLANGTGDEWVILDISNPSAPVETGAGVNETSSVSRLQVVGKYLFITKGADTGTCVTTTGSTCEINIYDISNPAQEVFVQGIETNVGANGQYISGDYGYFGTNASTTGAEVFLYNIANPASPTLVSSIERGANVRSLYLSGKYLYVFNDNIGGTCDTTTSTGCEISLYDVSNPASPSFKNGVNIGQDVIEGQVANNYVYVSLSNNASACNQTSSAGCEFRIFNISDVNNIFYSGGHDLNSQTTKFSLYGKYAFVSHLIVAGAGECTLTNPLACEVQVLSLSGIQTPSLSVGALSASSLNVLEVIRGNSGFFDTSLNVGAGGIYSMGSLSIGASGTALTTIGSVGIGTSTPGSLLSVGGAGYFGGNLTATGTLSITGTSTLSSILTVAGNVGIGTTTPDIRLTINDSAATLLKLQRNGGTDANTGLVFDGLTTDFHMGYNGTNFAIDTDNALSSGALFVLTPGGNVGIGSTSPTDTLSVTGTGFFSGLVRMARLAITGLSSAFTPSAEGEIGIDTTDNQIKYLANGTTSILSPYVEQAFIYATSSMGAGTTTIKLAGFPSATTFGLLGCTSHGTGTFIAVLGNGTASATPEVATPTGSSTTFTALSSNNSFASGSSTVWAIGSVSGQVINPTCSFRRLINGT